MVDLHVERTIHAAPEPVFDCRYTIPARAGGRVTEALTVPLFRSSFRAILAGCAKALEH